MEIGFVQFSPEFGEKRKNIEKVIGLIGNKRADLIVLPELFATGYLFLKKDEVREYAEDAKKSDTIEAIRELSKEKNAVFVGGFAEKEGGNVYNSQFVVSGDKTAIYRKAHLFYKEKLIFDMSQPKYVIFDTGRVKLGMMICFDWMFPEMMRTLALHGADVICHSANLVMPFCQKAMVTRAIENRVYIVTANRNGNEKRGEEEYSFTGRSQIVAPGGDVILSSGADDEVFMKIDVNEQLARNKSINKMNDIFKDRRTDLYKL